MKKNNHSTGITHPNIMRSWILTGTLALSAASLAQGADIAYTWTGGSSNDWDDLANWGGTGKPADNGDGIFSEDAGNIATVTIQNGTFLPTVNVPSYANQGGGKRTPQFVIEPGAALDIRGNVLTYDGGTTGSTRTIATVGVGATLTMGSHNGANFIPARDGNATHSFNINGGTFNIVSTRIDWGFNANRVSIWNLDGGAVTFSGTHLYGARSPGSGDYTAGSIVNLNNGSTFTATTGTFRGNMVDGVDGTPTVVFDIQDAGSSLTAKLGDYFGDIAAVEAGKGKFWISSTLGDSSLVCTDNLDGTFTVSALSVSGLHWDGTEVDGDANGGDGNWDLTTPNWDDAATAGTATAWTPNDGTQTANFGGTGGIVTLMADIDADTVNVNSAGYSFGGTNSLTANELVLNQDTTVSAPLAGSGTLTKSGPGTLTLDGASSGFTGTLDATKGRVDLTGSLGGSVLVQDDATLDGGGTIGTDLQLGSTGGAGTSLSVDSTDVLDVTGNLTLEGVTTLDFDVAPAIGVPEPFITYSGTLTPVDPGVSFGYGTERGSVADNAGTLEFTLGGPETSTWNNAAATGTWSVGPAGGNGNWTSSDTFFFGDDTVTFDGTAPGTVTLDGSAGAIEPWSVTFTNTSGNDYSLTGDGIGGSGDLTKTGDGTVTLDTVNTYSGGTVVTAGVLELTSGGQVGAVRGTLEVSGPGTTLRLARGNALGYGGGTKVNILDVFDGALVDHVANADNGWGITINLRGSTMTTVNGTGVGDDVARWSLGGGSSVNTEASADSSEIAGLIRVRQNPVPFYVEDGAAAVDLLVSADIEPQGNDDITKDGPGYMLLSGANTLNGTTTVLDGCLVLDGPASLAVGAEAGVTVGFDGAGFGFMADNFTDGEIETIIAAVTWDTLGESYLVLDTGGGTVTVGADLAGNYKLLAKGGGTLNLTGTVPAVIETEDGTIVNVVGGITGIKITGITTGPGSVSGKMVTIAFATTGSGNIDVWASGNLQSPGTNLGTVASSASPFIEDNVAESVRFYILITEGAGDPFPAP